MQRIVIDNRYKIIKKLGAGSMGDVYKVQDSKDNKIMALKILSREKTSSETVQRFKREFDLLAGLYHPNLCPVYDFGLISDGRSYFTMEYIDGLDIFKATRGLGYRDIYPWVVQLCRVLEYIHAKGLIHYDMKPSNVLIHMPSGRLTDGVVKLMDFGLAGEQRIKGGLIIKGTLPYIAPEIIKGFSIDHRIDLYSLGVLLYEIFTRRPFQIGRTQESFTAQLRQEMMKSPPMSLKFVPQTNKNLRRLLIKLTAIEPNQRYSRANEVTKDITKIAGCRFEFETEKTIEGYLLSSHFVGRDKEMGLLKTLYEQSRSGNGKLVLITGETGIGKSRLLKEFRVFAQLNNIHCFVGYAYKETTQSLEPFYTIFKELLNYIDDGSIPKMPMAILSRMFPDLRKKYWAEKLPKLVALEPKQEWLRNFDALFSLLQYATSNLGNIIILLENLQWADDLSIQFLEYLAHNLERSNILICGSCRTEEIINNLKLRQIIKNLREEGLLTNLGLKPLNFMNLRSFLDSTITPTSNSSELIKYLLQKTGGNPFFVEEIMRNLLKSSKVSIGERMRIEELKQISVPETIEDLVLKRLQDLDSISQKVVKFAAIVQKSFKYDLMKRLTGLDDTELSGVLWELKRRQILIEEGDTYRFYHEALYDVVSKRLDHREKSELNYRVGNTLEIINLMRLTDVVEDLAHYFINARNHKKGIGYGLQAAEKSSKRYAYEQAIIFYKHVLALLGNKNLKLRFDILQKLAEVEVFVCRYDDAIKHYYNVLDLKNVKLQQRAEVYKRIGNVFRMKAEYSKALVYYKRAFKLLKEIRKNKRRLLLKASINAAMAFAYQVMGDYKNAYKFNSHALKFLKGLQGKEAIKERSGVNYNIGVTHFYKGNYDFAISKFKNVHRHFIKLNETQKEGEVLNALGYIYHHIKSDLKKAIDYYQKSMRIFNMTGNPDGQSAVLISLGSIFLLKGDYTKSLDYIHKALAISKKITNKKNIALSLFSAGISFYMLCDSKKAKEYCLGALKLWKDVGKKEDKAYAISILGDICQEMGDYTQALRFYRISLRIFKEIRDQNNIGSLFNRIGLVFISIGKFPMAKRYIDDALRIATTIKVKSNIIDCLALLCQMSIIKKDVVIADDYYKRGIKIVKEFGLRREDILQFFLLVSEIYYLKKRYLQGIEAANKAIKLAKATNRKNLYTEALLIKAKNGISQGILSNAEVVKILDEAKEIAESIGYPEILWKVYFEYGNFLKENKKRFQALRYYRQAIMILKDVVAQIRNQSNKNSYLMRPDRKAVIETIGET